MRAASTASSKARLFAIAALVLIPLLLAVTGLELLTEFGRSREQRTAIDRSYETRTQIQRVFSLMQDAETGQRGFVITGDPRFLQPYNEAIHGLDEQLDVLSALLAGEPHQSVDFAELRRLVETRREILRRGIQARDEQGPQIATAFIAEGAGKKVMDDIRLVVARMTTREAAALASRAREGEARTQRTEHLVTGLFVLLLIVISTAAFVVWRHIRTRQALLTEIEATAARQQAIFDSAIDAIITLNPSGSIETVNAAAETMFGYSAAELDRRDIALLMDVAGNGEGAFLARLGASHGALEHGLVRELRARRRDGQEFPADVALGAMELPSGTHVVAVIRDITERRRVEQMKEEFVSTVSHELRTPLTSISGSLGLLAGGTVGALPDKAARLIAIAQSNCQRLVRLINDILDIEKIESGQLQLDMQALDLRDIAERSIEGVRGLADSLKVTLLLDGGPSAPVRGDADRLVQVVTNLLSNACKFSPTGGEVGVGVYPETRLARLSVKDHGPGVPEAFRSRIFSKFAQADGSDTRAKGGTGLGLAIAREIAERHGGRLWFESTPGEGATFHLDLPLVTEVAERDAAGARLLIVEDDPDAAEVLRQMLEQEGLEADVSGTARQALAAIRAGDYQAVLVDLHLPDADGVSLIRALRAEKRTRGLPVIVVSADIARGKGRGKSLEIADWLEKPFDQERLSAAIAALPKRTAHLRPLVLYVEDDRDIAQVTASALSSDAEVRLAGSLAAARAALNDLRPDLVIVDLGLPDGSGLELLPDLTDESGGTIPVIVYSAQEMDAELAQRVEAVLTKSRTSLTTLARTVRRLTTSRRQDHEDAEGPARR